MKNYTFTIFISILSFSIFAQTPELITDFNVGEDDSFSNWDYEGIRYGDIIILPIISNEIGEELAVIDNGELQILKDINEGIEDGSPKNFTSFKGMVYFTAEDEENGEALWRTDGTEAGTELFFDPGIVNASPRSLTVAKNGWLYYSYSGSIFRTDGEVNEEAEEDGSMFYISGNASTNYSKYKEGIAYLNKNNDDSFSLMYLEEGPAVELAKTSITDFFADGIGVAPLQNGLMFSIDDSDEENAIYIYDEATQEISLHEIDGEVIQARRTLDFTEDKNIIWVQAKGYYSINGNVGEEELLFDSENSSATQGEGLISGAYNDHAAFVVTEGFFGDDFLIFTDGTAAGTSNLRTLSSYTSDILMYNKYGFMADGTSNGFDPTLLKIDFEQGIVDLVYNFSESSLNTDSVRPIEIQDGYLYFISNLDASIGAELYRIDLEIMVNTEEEIEQDKFDISQSGNSFNINMSESKNVDVKLLNSLGQVVLQKNVLSNNSFQLGVQSGSYFMSVTTGGKVVSKLVYIY